MRIDQQTERPGSTDETSGSEHVPDGMSRRAALSTFGGIAVAGVAATALAACSSSSTPVNTPLATAGDGGGDTKAPAATGDKPIVALSKVPVGSAVAAKLADGSGVFVSRPTAQTTSCFSSTCTHMGCTVNPPTSSDPKELHCPCHGSIYNALTGAVIQGPAPKALPKVDVKVENGEVVPA